MANKGITATTDDFKRMGLILTPDGTYKRAETVLKEQQAQEKMNKFDLEKQPTKDWDKKFAVKHRVSKRIGEVVADVKKGMDIAATSRNPLKQNESSSKDCIVILGRLYSSKNSRQIRHLKKKDGTSRPIVAKSNNSKKQESDFAIQLLQQKKVWEKMIAGKSFPLSVEFTYFPPDKGRFDWTNIVQNISDSMVKAGYIPDDDHKHLHPMFPKYVVVEKGNPRLIITVL